MTTKIPPNQTDDDIDGKLDPPRFFKEAAHEKRTKTRWNSCHGRAANC